MALKYIKGDVTKVQSTGGLRILVHIANNRGGWGSGVVLHISRRWPEPEKAYRTWALSESNFVLGQVQMVSVDDEYGKLYVANMVAQDGFVNSYRPRAVDYDALRECLNQVDEWVKSFLYVKSLMWRGKEKPTISIHMPALIGCGLGGGDKATIEKIIEETIGQYDVFAYELEQ
jgi:O-acetyl-ADP-ribose deacetylase (regulator of RNase III)